MLLFGTLFTSVVESSNELSLSKFSSDEHCLCDPLVDSTGDIVELEVGRHHIDGRVEKTRVKIEKDKLLEMLLRLRNSSSFEEEVEILKEYNLIPRGEDISCYEAKMNELRERFFSLNRDVQNLQNLGFYNLTNNTQVVFNLLCLVVFCDLGYGVTLNLPIGLSLLTGYLNVNISHPYFLG